MARRKNQSPQTLRVLAALLTHQGDGAYGYELTKATGIKSGTLYPILMRLADQGYLTADWRPAAQAGRPPRHVYQLTRHGQALAMNVADQRITAGGAPGAEPAI